MNHFIYFAILGLLATSSVKVQSQNADFIFSGKVTYEKSVNKFAIIRKVETSRQAIDNYISRTTQFDYQIGTLFLDSNRTLYVPDRSGVPLMLNSVIPFPLGVQRNRVYSNFTDSTVTLEKDLFEEMVIVTHPIQKFSWKITDEFREVAGFQCRRANAVILDSIYIVAFYAEKIHVSTGPESFSGLPGLILQVAIPHENISWKATRVEVSKVELPLSSGRRVSRRFTLPEFKKETEQFVKNLEHPLQGIFRIDFLL